MIVLLMTMKWNEAMSNGPSSRQASKFIGIRHILDRETWKPIQHIWCHKQLYSPQQLRVAWTDKNDVNASSNAHGNTFTSWNVTWNYVIQKAYVHLRQKRVNRRTNKYTVYWNIKGFGEQRHAIRASPSSAFGRSSVGNRSWKEKCNEKHLFRKVIDILSDSACVIKPFVELDEVRMKFPDMIPLLNLVACACLIFIAASENILLFVLILSIFLKRFCFFFVYYTAVVVTCDHVLSFLPHGSSSPVLQSALYETSEGDEL